ncbi:MAG TPA: nuclear transport factor 2 family protein [Gemmatimonadaceae bacterium]|nr:nuclear transport factor 2 family protein [Gemmatimonadaceae bacterium]
MTMETDKQELLDVESKFWDAMKTKDANAAARMTDDGCIIVGAQGVSKIDSKSMGKMTAEGKWELKRFSFDEKNAQVRFLSDDVAIVAYKVNESVVVDGRTMPIEANDSSVWVRRDGEWLCALHTESLSGDPYGRDRADTQSAADGTA